MSPIAGNGFFLVLRSEIRQTKTDNSDYADLTLRYPDNHPTRPLESIPAKIWGRSLKAKVSVGDIISAVYNEDQWQNKAQLVIEKYSVTSNNPNDPLFKLKPAIDVEAVYSKLFEHAFYDEDLARFTTSLRNYFQTQGLEQTVKDCPAATKNHHARLGGLLQHLEEMWDLAELLMAYPKIKEVTDREMVLVSILLHDLGKIFEYDTSNMEYRSTIEGELITHPIWGGVIVERLWPSGASEEKKYRLMHCVFSHHGSTSIGAPMPPKTPEASLLHMVDAISARYDVHRAAQAKADRGDKSDFSKMLGATPFVQKAC